ncbi:MAG: AAC(3) family N-acetyltransferase [Beijerinckiaceae bacterium]
MEIPGTTAEFFSEHLWSLGVRRGDCLMVHSSMFSFGIIEGGLDVVLQALIDAVGAEGTIAVPTYSYVRGTVFHRASTPSYFVGAFSEHVRKHPNAIRSRSPMFSHAAIGEKAKLLDELDGRFAVGPGSDFDMFHREGFKLLLLGVTIGEGAAYGHHLEALAGVPYREWRVLDREVVGDDGVIRKVPCHYYAWPDFEQRPYVDHFDPIEHTLRERDLITIVPAPLGSSSFCHLGDFTSVGLDLLAKDPFALVRPA